MVVRDLVYKLLEFFDASINISWVGILSNGTLITRREASRLRAFRCVREIQVSLDGANSKTHDAIRGQGAFVRALRGLQYLKEAGLPTAIMFTLSRANYREVIPIIELALRLQVDAITIERVIPLGAAREAGLALSRDQLRTAYEAVACMKRNLEGSTGLRIRTARPLWCLVGHEFGGFCPVGFMCLCLLHDGTLLPCRRLEIPIGNIFREGLYKIWYTSPVLWDLRRSENSKGRCRTCEFLGRCRGCRAAAFAATGDYLAEDPDCWKEGLMKGVKP